MASTVKRKVTFGSSCIDHCSPPLPVGTPKVINLTLSFEEALKLQLSLGQLLGHLNGYNRSTSDGKRTAVNLSIHAQHMRVSVAEGKTRKPSATAADENGNDG